MQADKKINLLIEVSSFDKGGLEKVVLDSAVRFDRHRFNVIVVSIGKTGYLAGLAEQHDIRVYRLPFFNKRSFYRRILSRLDINLSNSHFSYFGYPLLKAAGIPNITFIHNVYAFLTTPMLAAFRDADRYVDHYISVSNGATRYAVGRLGVREDRITTIPNGLILNEHEARKRNALPVTRSEFGLNETDYVFLNVASYNLHKGHYLMADAMRRVKRTRRDIKILCIGNVITPAPLAAFRRYLQEAGLDRDILLPGYYPNVESFYGISDAFLLPSLIEGWSIAMNEAMFYGKPMILTRTGAAEDVVENNDIGVLIDNEYGDSLALDAALLYDIAYHRREFGTAGQLAAAMADFADRRGYWRAAGERGHEKVVKKYDFDKTIDRYEQVFEIFARRKP